MSKVLVIGDIHGRRFWKKPCKNIDKYEKVIFLGDYFDPYDFEGIRIIDCIQNFTEIINLKQKYMDKVVLLLGNHDFPYVSNDYFRFSWYHCRHSSMYHNEINDLFNKYRDYFEVAYAINDILFTHAGVESGWLEYVVKCKETNINTICKKINELQNSVNGLEKLYSITSERGGRDKYGSCIWADVHDLMWDSEKDTPISHIKQVFGHTMQAFYDQNGEIVFGDAVEFTNCKMVDTAKPYELDIDKFKLKKI